MLAQVLRPVQEIFNPADYPDLLVGLQTPDDGAVWKLDDRRGLVLTTDFFTPVVDDARDYGRIAAANSLSDIYAMGSTPFLALNIAALPPDLDPSVSQQILLGGAEIAREAGVVVAGGHTVQDKEPKFGMVVAGFVDLDSMFTKAGAKVGEHLYLTKPLGFGAITTALKQDKVKAADLAVAVEWMTRLNKNASLAARQSGVHGATDITGYSFLGHASEMAQASRVCMQVIFDTIPLLENALPYAEQYIFPGGAHDNQRYFSQKVTFIKELPEYLKLMLFDPQTSGGLLLSVPEKQCENFESTMRSLEQPFWKIGEVVNGQGIIIL
ncbi:MAG: selenide water dikinase [Chloroflexi bacterium]|nr:MAG: selenide water dikinase [Chloroflexota bacterium]